MRVSCSSGVNLPLIKAGATLHQTCACQLESSFSSTLMDELSNHTCRTRLLYANMPGAGMVIAQLVCAQALRMRRRRRRARQRFYRTPLDVLAIGEAEVYRLFRFNTQAIQEITTILQDDLTSPTHRSHAVQPLIKVLATLHFLATGSFQRTSGGVAGMSQTSMSRCVHQVVPAILRHMSNQIVRPTQEVQRNKARADFVRIAGFPRTIGAIDCTHVALQPPRDTEHLFRNRKHWHSINVQVIVDAHGLIWHVRAKHPGSSHDSFIYRQSDIPMEFDQNVYGDSWLVGE